MSRMSRQPATGSRTRPRPDPKADSLEKRVLAALAQAENLVVLASNLATHSLPAPDNRLAGLVKQVAEQYPARFYGLGELLADLVPTATRLAAQGLQPLVLLGSTDLARSYAGMSAICAQHLRVIFMLVAGPRAGQTWRAAGINDLAILRTLPPLLIGAPSGLLELAQQLDEAAQVEDQPVALYFQAGSSRSRPEAPAPQLARSPGLGHAVMLREGRELALLSLGAATTTALALADRLAEAGHQAAVVDVRWVRPLDEALLTAVAHHFPRLVTLEEGGLEASFGSAVLELLETRGLYETRLRRLEVDRRPNLSQLVNSVTAFLDTLQRDEGLAPVKAKLDLRPGT